MTIVDQLLAWSGWRWMVGMASDDEVIVHTVKDGVPCGWSWNPNGWTEPDPIDYARPDLTHLGTLGLIEHGLLRDAWGTDAIIQVTRWPDGWALVTVVVGAVGPHHRGVRLPSLGEALVVACLDAPPQEDP